MSGAINSVPNTPSRPAQGQIYLYFDNDVVRLRRNTKVSGAWMKVDSRSKNQPAARCELEFLFVALNASVWTPYDSAS